MECKNEGCGGGGRGERVEGIKAIAMTSQTPLFRTKD